MSNKNLEFLIIAAASQKRFLQFLQYKEQKVNDPRQYRLIMLYSGATVRKRAPDPDTETGEIV